MTWRLHARRALEQLAYSGDEFTSDDLVDLVGPPDNGHTANSRNNAIGKLFNEAAAAGLIETDGRVRPSRQPHRKGGGNRVWRGTPRPTLFDSPVPIPDDPFDGLT